MKSIFLKADRVQYNNRSYCWEDSTVSHTITNKLINKNTTPSILYDQTCSRFGLLATVFYLFFSGLLLFSDVDQISG